MKSIVQYNKQLNEITGITSLFLLYLLITSSLAIVIRLLMYLLGILSFNKSIKGKKELTEYSKKLSDILSDNVVCYIVKDPDPNAFNVGQKDCYMTDKLFDMLSDKERIAVFLHEYGHYKNKHHIKILGTETTFGILTSVTMNIILYSTLGFIIPPLTFIISLFVSQKFADNLSKSQEYEADEFVKQYGYEKDLLTGLKKIEKWIENQICKGMKKKDCVKAIKALHDNTTHPEFKDRFNQLLKTPVIQKFIFVMAIKPEDDIFQTTKQYLKHKWTDIFGQKEVLK